MRLETIFRFEIIIMIFHLVSILILLCLNFGEFKNQAKRIKRWALLVLFFILIFGLILRLEYLYVHNNPVGDDELLHIEEAKNILLSFQKDPCYLNEVYSHMPAGSWEDASRSLVQKCELGRQYPLSYSFFVFVFSFFFGSFEEGAFFVSFVFGLLSIFLMFFLVYFLFKEEVVALFAALFFSFFPSFVEFSGTPNNFMTSVFFIELSAVLMLLAISSNMWKSWFLAGLVLVFTLMMRVENLLVVVLFISFVLVHKKEKKKILLSFLTAFLFYIPTFLFLTHPLTVGSATLHNTPFEFLRGIPVHSIFYNVYFNLKYSVHFSFWILVLIGFYFLFRYKKVYFCFIISWFLMFFSLYTAYNIALCTYSLDRFIFSHLPLIIASSVGFFSLFKILSYKKYRMIILYLLLMLVIYLNIVFLIHYPGRTGFDEEHQYLQLKDFGTIQVQDFDVGRNIKSENFSKNPQILDMQTQYQMGE